MYMRVRSINDRLKFQADIGSISVWFSTWGLSHSPSECQVFLHLLEATRRLYLPTPSARAIFGQLQYTSQILASS